MRTATWHLLHTAAPDAMHLEVACRPSGCSLAASIGMPLTNLAARQLPSIRINGCSPQCAGNILFVLSYQWRSLAVLLAARLLNGCGSARTANRRYTADYVSKAHRTMASAGAGGWNVEVTAYWQGMHQLSPGW